MAMTYKEMMLVKGTIPTLHENGEHIATVFYKTMLKDHPDLNNYFNSVNMRNGRQPRALTSVILTFASNISHISELTPKLERVANKHVSLGIRPEDYEIVGKYLMRAFAAVLGEDMTPEIRVAWTKAYWVLARMLSAREAQIYHDFQPWSSWRHFIIDKKTPETLEGDIMSLSLKPVDGGQLPSFMPGQYISLRLRVPGSAYFQIRQYSLSDAPRPDGYRITVKREIGDHVGCDCELDRSAPGVMSNLLFDDLREGDVLELSHPAGDFYLDVNNDAASTPLVLISAGVGVSPMLSMLNTVVDRHLDRPISWIQAARGSTPFKEHIDSLKTSNPLLRTSFLNTAIGNKDIAESTDTLGFGYYLEWLKPEDMFFDNKGTEYYMCGPERFMRDMTDYLETNGVPTSKVRYELHATGAFELQK
ncbi:globin-like protein [Pseudomassariella vexata]|uniref:nitric oxide dioxygenase n=1 Tax=Pseudomassariella vexata TaxID=1141098 RepID=A0A1Y2DW10_9PEZI|nr:globin-like protein [Pseudomassariella vexata]ORY63482.1 globin-like protein [Pseudomassariella vexata]